MEEDSILGDLGVDDMMSDEEIEFKSECSSTSHEAADFVNTPPVRTSFKDIWLGKKYFEYVIACKVLSQSSQEEAVPALESKVKAVLKDFPCHKCFAYLQSKELAGEYSADKFVRSYRHTLLSWIGRVTQNGLQRERAYCRKAILKFGSIPISPAVSQPADNGSSSRMSSTTKKAPRTASTRARTKVSNLAAPPVPDPPSMDDLPRYTTRLKEFGDHHRVVPNYVWKTVSTLPPKFSCTVSFEDVQAEGFGHQKQIAKNYASFNACRELGVELE